MKKIAIFASGSGTNAENIIQFFKDSDEVKVVLVLTNNPEAGVIKRVRKLNVPSLVFNKQNFAKEDTVVNILENNQIDWVILAGFLWLVPQNLVHAFSNKIINIHPALLPKYGGKGMWGNHVHEAVVQNKETESGITIHLVNEHYDQGKVLFQANCQVKPQDTADDVAQKIHTLEYEHFPKIIQKCISGEIQ